MIGALSRIAQRANETMVREPAEGRVRPRLRDMRHFNESQTNHHEQDDPKGLRKTDRRIGALKI